MERTELAAAAATLAAAFAAGSGERYTGLPGESQERFLESAYRWALEFLTETHRESYKGPPSGGMV